MCSVWDLRECVCLVEIGRPSLLGTSAKLAKVAIRHLTVRSLELLPLVEHVENPVELHLRSIAQVVCTHHATRGRSPDRRTDGSGEALGRGDTSGRAV